MDVLGAVVIPSLVLALLFLMPIVGRSRPGHAFNVGLSIALVAGAALLTFLAIRHDHRDETHQAAVRNAEDQARRVKTLAASPTGIPIGGAVTLLRNDPLTQGPRLFARHCASCHRFGGHDGTGAVPADPESAADLQGFASREWLAGFLDPERISTSHYFGATKFTTGRMVRFVQKEVSKYSEDEKEQLRNVIIALSAEAQLPAQRALDQEDAVSIAAGQALLLQGELRCTECHQFRTPDEDATAPDLTGYGSREWLTAFVADPTHERFYGSRNDRMPAFGANEVLNAHAIGLIVDWLRGDWYEPGGNELTIR
jgi:ubiquinol-cytochrome c reductase cytochrome b subunit